MKADITIITVNFKSDRLLELNVENIAKRNKDIKIFWIVTENNIPIKNKNALVNHDNIDLHFLPEVSDGEVRKKYEKQKHLTNMDLDRRHWHHAIGLNNCLIDEIDSRFLLSLDPDCFIMSPISKSIQYILDNKLTFFGTPLASDTGNVVSGTDDFVNKPYATGMFIDLKKFDLKNIDYSPAFTSMQSRIKYGNVNNRVGFRLFEHFKLKNYEGLKLCSPSKCDSCKSILGKDNSFAENYYFDDNLFWGFHIHMNKHRLRPNLSEAQVEKVLRKNNGTKNIYHS